MGRKIRGRDGMGCRGSDGRGSRESRSIGGRSRGCEGWDMCERWGSRVGKIWDKEI